MSNSNHNERDKKNNSNSGEPSKGVLRLTDPDIAPSVRGLIVILILFKLITVNALKGRESLFLAGLDGVATFGFIVSLLLLGMLLWRKYGQRWMRP